MATEVAETEDSKSGFVRGLGLLDSTMIVAGSMIGSGIYIVSADIARQTGSVGGLILTWVITGIITMFGALSYGELAAMMPKAGGQYVYLRESYSPLWGFLFGWAMFLVIQTGTIAAVGVAFARFLGLLVPSISENSYLIAPVHLTSGYAISLSTQQLVAIVMIISLALLNMQGLKLGKTIQNVFTSAKTLSLFALIVIGLVVGGAAGTFTTNISNLFVIQNAATISPDISFLPEVSVTSGIFGVIVAFSVAQVGSLFSSDAWNNITFTAGEVKDPKRNIPLSLALGTGLVTVLYILANFAYIATLPFLKIQSAPQDRVGTLALDTIIGPVGAVVMAIAIIISTFGCANGLTLAGSRVYYAMAQDNLFFKSTGKLNAKHVPAVALALQCVWTCFLVLPRTLTGKLDEQGAPIYGNLYSALADYVIFAVLIFYILTIIGIFRLRRSRPHAERPYKAFGYPYIPALYVVLASVLSAVLLFYRPQTSVPGLLIVMTGVPVYFIWKHFTSKETSNN